MNQSVDENASRLVLAKRELIPSNGHLKRIAQRRHFSNIDVDAFGDAHVHDMTLDRTFAFEASDARSLPYPDILQSLL